MRHDHDGPGGDHLEIAGRDFTLLVRRVHGLSPAALRRRREALNTWLAEIRELTAVAAGRSMPILPIVAEHALADAVVVVGTDLLAVLTCRPDDAVTQGFARATGTALEATR